MASFDELFIPLPAFRTAICREHRSAVTAKSVASHVDLCHRYLAAHIRQRIAEEAAALQADGSLAADVHSVQFPQDVIPAIDGLPVWADGKKCVQCGHIRRARNRIQQHCWSEHGWVNPRKRGGKPGARPAGGLGQAWVDGVHCQRCLLCLNHFGSEWLRAAPLIGPGGTHTSSEWLRIGLSNHFDPRRPSKCPSAMATRQTEAGDSESAVRLLVIRTARPMQAIIG